ncbi:DUF624 domain-containing protein [Alkalicoccus urumqiensis]|uniref:DUF624 domain-containing protein n=1 Tax=Alkalicoccus urumqiensis TaxID=1548213 RepID=A0A2P6MJW7_ALKUR|nr:DUF624 domain-containing protein [Alkalicoccus urumqiensis]PRO66592.1 hypothetical protein C6I21_04410 [Alkalicoccus urumqiensis]
MNRVVETAEALFFLVKVNLLWIAGTLLGLAAAGAGPAAAAAHCLVRSRLEGEERLSSDWRFFWQSYRRFFLKGALSSLLFTAAGILLYMNGWILFRWDHAAAPVLLGLLLFLTVLYVCLLLYTMPIFALYGRSLRESMITALMYGFYVPAQTFSLLAAVVVLFAAGQWTGAVHLFFTAGALIWLTNLILLHRAPPTGLLKLLKK